MTDGRSVMLEEEEEARQSTPAHDCRAEFEKWYATNSDRQPPNWNGAEYDNKYCQYRWQGWQAAWNAKPTEPAGNPIAQQAMNDFEEGMRDKQIAETKAEYAKANAKLARSGISETGGWFIPLSAMSEIAQRNFSRMMMVITGCGGGMVDISYRSGDKDYQWQCDGLKYAVRHPVQASEQPVQCADIANVLKKAKEALSYIYEGMTIRLGDNTSKEEILLGTALAAINSYESTKREYGGWQDISTAPMDGTHILAIFQRNAEAYQQIVEVWWNPQKDEETGNFYQWESWDNCYTDGRIYYWMPCPVLPSNEIEGGK